MEWPTLGWLIGILVAIAIPIIVIFIVLWIIRRETIRKQEAVRSPEYWDERPDGRRYPTGWDTNRGPDRSDQGALREGDDPAEGGSHRSPRRDEPGNDPPPGSDDPTDR